MILGTRNFNQEYNGTFVSKEKSFKLLDYFYENGGRILDSAHNYKSKEIIAEWVKGNDPYDIKIITKISSPEQASETLREFGEGGPIYACLSRSSEGKIIDEINKYRSAGYIKNTGLSIYYPHELRSDVNIIQIPSTQTFDKYITTMLLHSKVYYRSFFNLSIKNYILQTGERVDKIEKIQNVMSSTRRLERKDLNHEIDFVVGCDNLKQLKENMELFK